MYLVCPCVMMHAPRVPLCDDACVCLLPSLCLPAVGHDYVCHLCLGALQLLDGPFVGSSHGGGGGAASTAAGVEGGARPAESAVAHDGKADASSLGDSSEAMVEDCIGASSVSAAMAAAVAVPVPAVPSVALPGAAPAAAVPATSGAEKCGCSAGEAGPDVGGQGVTAGAGSSVAPHPLLPPLPPGPAALRTSAFVAACAQAQGQGGRPLAYLDPDLLAAALREADPDPDPGARPGPSFALEASLPLNLAIREHSLACHLLNRYGSRGMFSSWSASSIVPIKSVLRWGGWRL